MRHSRYVDDCWKRLEDAQEYPSDAWLRHFIGTRHLAQRIIESLALDDHLEQGNSRNPALLEMTMKGFRQEVDQLEQGIMSSGAHVCKGLLLEVKSLVATIYEVAVCYQPTSSGPSSSLHASHLWNLLTSCRTLLQEQIAIPPETLQHLTLPTFKLVWYGFMLLIKFDVIPSSHSWDREMAQREANVEELGARVLAVLDQLWHPSRGECVWTHYRRGMDTMLRWHRECRKNGAAAAAAAATGGLPAAAPGAPNLFTPSESSDASIVPSASSSRSSPLQPRQPPSPDSLSMPMDVSGATATATGTPFFPIVRGAAQAQHPSQQQPDVAGLPGAFDVVPDPMFPEDGMVPAETMFRRFIDDYSGPSSGGLQTLGFFDPSGFAPFG
jgi:hypothetical protein